MTKEHEIIFAGFGGQGVLSMGRLIAYAGMIEGKEVSWMPSYGPEMRGGTANCIVIVSDSRISSPIVTKFDTAILLNQPSIDKFENAVKPGGLLIYEQSTAVKPPTRTDISITTPANNIVPPTSNCFGLLIITTSPKTTKIRGQLLEKTTPKLTLNS